MHDSCPVCFLTNGLNPACDPASCLVLFSYLQCSSVRWPRLSRSWEALDSWSCLRCGCRKFLPYLCNLWSQAGRGLWVWGCVCARAIPLSKRRMDTSLIPTTHVTAHMAAQLISIRNPRNYWIQMLMPLIFQKTVPQAPNKNDVLTILFNLTNKQFCVW